MSHLKTIEKAIIYIEEHLGDNITVEDVADSVGYSYYHLTRMFSATIGENVGNYIKKRRLADGAKKLIYTDKKIIDIAIENGFESSESFSRAFKTIYKTSPITYRKNRLDLFISGKQILDQSKLSHVVNQLTVHPKIVEMPEILVTGIRGQTTLADNVLPLLWDELNNISHMIPDVSEPKLAFGICEACIEGNDLYSINNNSLFSNVVGIEVNSFQSCHLPFVNKRIKAGKYAVFTHLGCICHLYQTYNYIWGTWFHTTNEVLDNREDFELYDHRFLGRENPMSETDIYIPIK